MKKDKSKVKVKGTARVKKFNPDQDETKDIPVEVMEREFELTEEQIKQVKKGKKIEILNGEVIIKE
jgi:hypothetical protein